MANFLLLLNQAPGGSAGHSPEDIQAVVQRYRDWSANLAAEGKLAGGDKLADEGGRVLRRDGDRLSVTDGPSTEAKEVLGGFFKVTAADYDEAVAIAGTCPHVDLGGTIAIRQVDEM